MMNVQGVYLAAGSIVGVEIRQEMAEEDHGGLLIVVDLLIHFVIQRHIAQSKSVALTSKSSLAQLIQLNAQLDLKQLLTFQG